jgi:acetyl esterase/lipase
MMTGPLAKGFDAAMIGYTLCPDVTLTELVAETHAAIRYLRKEGPRRGFGAGKLIVSGWSAGGHLTASALPLDEVDAGLAISGIYDVGPCRLNYLNEKLNSARPRPQQADPPPEKRKALTVAFPPTSAGIAAPVADYHQARVAAAPPSTLLPIDLQSLRSWTRWRSPMAG